ncbi:MAG: AMP-binding protein, partial [Acidimicrobiia bacterium]
MSEPAAAKSETTIESLLVEGRTFAPSAEFVAGALVRDRSVFDEAEADPEAFWARQAEELVSWDEPWHTVCEWDLPFAKWFVGGSLNVAYNCLDRHVEAGAGDKVAYFWEGEPGDARTITYAELLDDVSRLANALKSLGVEKGDRVNVYLGMVPELPMALLACARIGAVHSVVFGGFSSDSLRDRINDAQAKVLITGDGAWRRGQVIPLKETADTAVAECPTIEKVLVLKRTEQDVPMVDGRDVWWHDLVSQQSADCPPESMDAEDLLYLLYTS